MLDVSLQKVEVKKNGLLLSFVNASLEIFWTNIHNNYIVIQSSESRREKKKRWVWGVRALYFDLRISLWKIVPEPSSSKTLQENHIYPHYWGFTLRSKKSKANPIQTASLTSTRFVSMAVFHSYTSKEKGLQFVWHPNPGLSLSIRALCKRWLPAKTTQLDCYEQLTVCGMSRWFDRP